MIKGLDQSGRYTVVSAGNSIVPYVNQNMDNPIQGMIRISGNDMQVFVGNSWIVMNTSYATVGLTGEAESLLDWARQKRDEERMMASRAEKSVAVADALATYQQAQEQLMVVLALTQ